MPKSISRLTGLSPATIAVVCALFLSMGPSVGHAQNLDLRYFSLAYSSPVLQKTGIKLRLAFGNGVFLSSSEVRGAHLRRKRFPKYAQYMAIGARSGLYPMRLVSHRARRKHLSTVCETQPARLALRFKNPKHRKITPMLIAIGKNVKKRVQWHAAVSKGQVTGNQCVKSGTAYRSHGLPPGQRVVLNEDGCLWVVDGKGGCAKYGCWDAANEGAWRSGRRSQSGKADENDDDDDDDLKGGYHIDKYYGVLVLRSGRRAPPERWLLFGAMAVENYGTIAIPYRGVLKDAPAKDKRHPNVVEPNCG